MRPSGDTDSIGWTRCRDCGTVAHIVIDTDDDCDILCPRCGSANSEPVPANEATDILARLAAEMEAGAADEDPDRAKVVRSCAADLRRLRSQILTLN